MTGQGTSPGLVAAGDVAALATAAADATAKANAAQAASQPLDADLTALAALDATAGLVEQTGAATFTKRLIGVGAGTSIPTKSDVDTLIAAGGGGSAAFTAPPVASGWTQKGATSATLTDVTVQGSACLLVAAPGTTQDRWIRNGALGSTWQVSAAFCMKPNNGGGGHESLYGLAISGGGDPFIRFGCYAIAAARADGYDLQVQVQRHSGLSGPGAAPFSIIVGPWGTYQTLWLRAEQDGTNIVYSISYDGYDWVQLFSESKTAYLTATEIGIMACDSVPNTTTSRLMSWVVA